MKPETIIDLNLQGKSLVSTAGMLETTEAADFVFRILPYSEGRQRLHFHPAFSKASIYLKNPPATYRPTFSLKEINGRTLIERRPILIRDETGILHDKLDIWVSTNVGHLLTVHVPASEKRKILVNTYFNPRLNITIGRPNSTREVYDTLGNP